MAKIIGRNINTNSEATVTTYTLSNVTPSVIGEANDQRIAMSVSLDCGGDDQCAFIRLYPATQDDDKKGDLLQRITSTNDAISVTPWKMLADNIYTGEVSAIADIDGTVIHVTEY